MPGIRNIEALAAGFEEKYPAVAELLRGPVVTKALELGVPDRYPRDQKALDIARTQFMEVRREFKHSPHTPDLVQRYWQARWGYLGKRVGLQLEIPDHRYYQDEIEGLEHMSPKRKLAYGPDQFYQTPEGLVLLSVVHSKMRAWVDKPDTALSRVTHSSNKGGWFHIESEWQTPFTNTAQADLNDVLKEIAEANKPYIWKGQRLPIYIIGSQDSYDLVRHHFDENGLVRLLGSSAMGGGGGRLQFWG